MPVSAGLLTDTDAYFDALTAYRAGDPTVIVNQLAQAAFTAVGSGRQLVTDLRTIRAAWIERPLDSFQTIHGGYAAINQSCIG